MTAMMDQDCHFQLYSMQLHVENAKNIVEYLLETKSFTSFSNQNGKKAIDVQSQTTSYTALHTACGDDRVRIVSLCSKMKEYVDVNIAAEYDTTPLTRSRAIELG